MEEQLITFKTAKLAKELGFNEFCNYAYNQNGDSLYSTDDISYPAPTQSLFQKWFRDKYNIHIKVDDFTDDESNIEWDYEIVTIGTDLDEKGNYVPLISYDMDNLQERKFKSFEDALEEGLQKTSKIVKKLNE